MKNWFNIVKGEKNTGRIDIFGDIMESGWEWSDSDVSPARFAEGLKNLGGVELIELYINSLGGHVYAGIAIGNILRAHSALVVGHVIGIAGSIASVLLQACDERHMWSNTAQFVHCPLTCACGNAKQLRETADDLDRVQVQIVQSYMEKVKIDEAKLVEIMNAESLLSAQECIEMGFADTIDDKNEAKIQNAGKAHLLVNGVDFDFSKFKNVSTGHLKESKEADPIDYSVYENALINNEHQILEAQILTI